MVQRIDLLDFFPFLRGARLRRGRAGCFKTVRVGWKLQTWSDSHGFTIYGPNGIGRSDVQEWQWCMEIMGNDEASLQANKQPLIWRYIACFVLEMNKYAMAST